MTQGRDADPTGERSLREKIRAGSHELDDYRDLAHLLFSLGRPEEVVPLYRQALNLSLTNVQRAMTSVQLGWTLLDVMGKEAEARTLAEDAVRHLVNEPENSEVLFVRGEGQALLAYSMWRGDETAATEAARLALAALEDVIAESPDLEHVTQALRDAARMQNLLGKPEIAIPLCERALERELPPGDRLYSLITLSDALLRANRPREAGEVVDEAFQYLEADEGALPRLHFLRGLILRAMNRPSEALESFRQVLKVLQTHPTLRDDPGYLVGTHKNLGELYYESGEYRQAAKAFGESVKYIHENVPDYPIALLWLADCYVRTREHVKARDCFEEVLASTEATEDQKASAREGLAALPPLPKGRSH